jgi:hypothetical protein
MWMSRLGHASQIEDREVAKILMGRKARTKSAQLAGSLNVDTTTVRWNLGEAVAVLLANARKEIAADTAVDRAAVRQHELTAA